MPTSLESLAALVGGTVVGDCTVSVTDAATLETAGPDHITLVDASD